MLYDFDTHSSPPFWIRLRLSQFFSFFNLHDGVLLFGIRIILSESFFFFSVPGYPVGTLWEDTHPPFPVFLWGNPKKDCHIEVFPGRDEDPPFTAFFSLVYQAQGTPVWIRPSHVFSFPPLHSWNMKQQVYLRQSISTYIQLVMGNTIYRAFLQETSILGVPPTIPVHTVRAIALRTLTVRGMDIISVGRPV